MENDAVHLEICYKLTSIKIVKEHIKSLIWYGSASTGQDLHVKSDCDLQIVLDKPNYEVIVELNTLLEDYPHVDLSIIYLKDIYDKNNRVIFQNGTKGLFFVYVLSSGKILYGENIYKNISNQLKLDQIKPSLSFTIREYLSRLRIMATHSPNDTLKFKKYSLKLLKDILVFRGAIDPSELVGLNYDKTLEYSLKKFKFNEQSLLEIKKIIDFDTNYSKKEMASLLYDYESIVDKVVHE